MEAGYIKLHRLGKLQDRIKSLIEKLKNCNLCPRNCNVNRTKKTGFCKTGILAGVSSYSAHFGEERPLVARHGSGTIFFSGCNLGCVFCQNYDISHYNEGPYKNKAELADIMLGLQRKGCHNINFVSPSHVVPQIVEALPLAIEAGLNVPLVYNTGGYDSTETIELLDGIIDIYMPDMKYGDNKTAERLSCAKDYWDINKEAVKLMYEQVGDLIIKDGVARRGLLIRHLVLPNLLANSKAILEFLAEEISTETYLNIMDQYYPTFKASNLCDINRKLTSKEFSDIVKLARNMNFTRLD